MDVSSGDGSFSLLTLINPKWTDSGWYSCFAVKVDVSQGATPVYTNETGFDTIYQEVIGESLKAQTLACERTKFGAVRRVPRKLVKLDCFG